MALPVALVVDRPWTLVVGARTWGALLGLRAAQHRARLRDLLPRAGDGRRHQRHARDPAHADRRAPGRLAGPGRAGDRRPRSRAWPSSAPACSPSTAACWASVAPPRSHRPLARRRRDAMATLGVPAAGVVESGRAVGRADRPGRGAALRGARARRRGGGDRVPPDRGDAAVPAPGHSRGRAGRPHAAPAAHGRRGGGARPRARRHARAGVLRPAEPGAARRCWPSWARAGRWPTAWPRPRSCPPWCRRPGSRRRTRGSSWPAPWPSWGPGAGRRARGLDGRGRRLRRRGRALDRRGVLARRAAGAAARAGAAGPTRCRISARARASCSATRCCCRS